MLFIVSSKLSSTWGAGAHLTMRFRQKYMSLGDKKSAVGLSIEWCSCNEYKVIHLLYFGSGTDSLLFCNRLDQIDIGFGKVTWRHLASEQDVYLGCRSVFGFWDTEERKYG